MPTAVVTVRWLQPPRYRGMEETVSRSRVRQRGHLSVGEEVRVRYKRSYYKAEIIDNGEVSSTEPADHGLPVETHTPASSTGSSLDSPAPAISPSSTSSPSLLDADDVLFLERDAIHLVSPVSNYSVADAVEMIELEADSDAYGSDISLSDDDDFEAMPTFMTPEESDAAILRHAQRLIDHRIGSRPRDTDPTNPRPSPDVHTCSSYDRIDNVTSRIEVVIKSVEDAVRSTEACFVYLSDLPMTALQRLHASITFSMRCIDDELLPMVESFTAILLREDMPCLRCLVDLGKTARRCHFVRDDLIVFKCVASGQIRCCEE
ncbi:uncharacterized protein LOC121415917 [Lytechinus variegatus]|uniref:uncharacterized protein LOC121415917 n=1 Tax=Lytechinus variegatus TaxID=7654 RepID=UPI001BB1A3DB|nr:uncharacterized protein LOC121415917 [Lytechinus variegatus]